MSRRLGLLACTALATGAVVAACGSSGNSGGGGGGGGGGSSSGAKVIDVNSMNNAKGNITWCTGKDTTGAIKQGIADFNAKYGSQGLKAKILEFPEEANEQRNQFIQREQAKSPECDLFNSDVTWTSEFAAQHWLYDVTPYVKQLGSKFVPSTLETGHYQGKYWGVPYQTNSAFLYYRTDQVDSAPTTWQQVYQEAAQKNGIVYQGAPYEGLTVDFLELAFAAGGQVVSPDGKKSVINSPANVAALTLMVNGLKNGAAPKAVTTYTEEPSRRYWESGKATFMRNWPYAYALDLKAPAIKGKFKVVPFPKWQTTGKAASILGGYNLVVSAYSKNPGAALKLIEFMTSTPEEVKGFAKYANPPTVTAAYDSATVKKAIPFAGVLKQAVVQARTRPVSPVYPQISEAIYNNVNSALAGRISPADALKKADADINKALSTF